MPTLKPLLIDLCCGLGGWAEGGLVEGYEVIGIDIEPQPTYPGKFIQMDANKVPGILFRGARLIVASPPCIDFTRRALPWIKDNYSEPPDLSLIKACVRIAKEAEVPIVLENVVWAQKYIGQAKGHCGPFYLWGRVPLPLPQINIHKEKLDSSRKAERAKIPIELSRFIAKWYRGC